MIVKLAGTSGSGKSTFTLEFMKLWTFTPALWTPDKPKIKEYVATVRKSDPLGKRFHRVVVLGDYRSPCGGMDRVADKTQRYAMVARYSTVEHAKTLVLCEGLIFGGVYGVTEGLGVLSEKSPVPWVYAFMGTPLEVCLERCRQRRAARGVVEPMNPYNTTAKWQAVQCVKRRVENGGFKSQSVYTVDYKLKPATAVKRFIGYLETFDGK